MNVALSAALTMNLSDITTDELCALNNTITGFGCIPPENIAFKTAVSRSLVKDNGYPHDEESLTAALAFEIQRRMGEI